MTTWLDRSGQRWKLRAGTMSAWAGVALLVAWFPFKWHFALLASSLLFLPAGFVLPMLIRCRICGLRLRTSRAMLEQPIGDRETWLSLLEACPVCDDDGRATSEAYVAWSASGRASERPYWSWNRLFVGLLLVAVFVIGGVAIAELRIHAWVRGQRVQANAVSDHPRGR